MKQLKYEWGTNPVVSIFGGQGGGNSVLRGPGFYISYNPGPKMNMLEAIVDGSGKPETALYDIEKEKFYVLYGDWREEYESAYPSLEACMGVFNSFKENHIAKASNT